MVDITYTSQAEILAMMIHKPTYISKTVLKREYFTAPFDELFQIIEDCHKSYNDVILDELMKKFSNHDLLFNIVSNVSFTNNENHFKSLESHIIENFKTESTKKICNSFITSKSSLDRFIKDVNCINNLKISSYSNISKDELIQSLETSQENVLNLYYYPILNNVLELSEHDLIIIGANTGNGKSAFAINLMNDLSRNYPCVYFNFEISKKEFHYRMISINSGMNIKDIKRYKVLSEDEKETINKCVNNLSKREIKIIEKSKTLKDIEHILSDLDTNTHTIVFIDHLLLIKSNKNNGLRENITEIAQELRRFSIDYNITIIALCQLNRASNENRNDGKPYLSALKESGEIENSASKVLFLYYDNNNNYKVSISKNRSGRLGEFNLNWNVQTQEIRESKCL